ncbi:hypothetical protein, partial [Pseudomonas lurida]|uniref:hypothetical protein n=1 Tax=Pseudomonas lurida TaxID=244566 RepID=UPI0034D95C63
FFGFFWGFVGVVVFLLGGSMGWGVFNVVGVFFFFFFVFFFVVFFFVFFGLGLFLVGVSVGGVVRCAELAAEMTALG